MSYMSGGWQCARPLAAADGNGLQNEQRIQPMAQRTRPTLAKRQREQARSAKHKYKAPRRAERARRPPNESNPEGVDPDIADIRPGPQPPAEWQIEGDE